MEQVQHVTVNGKYQGQIERAAVKGVDGFKVGCNTDDLEEWKKALQEMYDYAIGLTRPDAKAGESPEGGK